MITKTKKLIILQLSILFVLLTFFSCKDQKKLSIQEAMNKNANEFLKLPDINSVSIGIYKKGEIFMSHYGELDSGKSNPPTNQTFYEIASTTKTFTGTLLAQAIVDNKINLDDDVQKYLDGSYENLSFKGRNVKIKDIVTHSAGLPRSLPDDSEIFKSTPFDSLHFKLDGFGTGYTKEEFLSDLDTLNITIKPGVKPQYGNVGPQLIAHILEKVYDLKYDALLKKFIFDKAGMVETKLVLSEQEEELRLANGYSTKGLLMPNAKDGLWGAAGGLKSTLPDLMKYMKLQFDSENKAILTSHEMIMYENGRNFESGYFWKIRTDEDEGEYYSVHGGSFSTQNYFMVFPEHNTGISIITNSSGQKTHHKMIKVINGILEHIR